MPEVVNIEYRNQNSLRKYPFEDEATMTDANGIELPTDFLIDAFMYPINLKGRVYISQIDLVNKRIHITDSGTGKECGYADFDEAVFSSPIYDNATFMRQIGILVFGADLPDVFKGYSVRNFTLSGAAFAPDTFIGMNQIGVRALVLPDGTILTGDVVIEGQNGVVVQTFTEGLKDVIYVDIPGVAPLDPELCGDLCPIIKTIIVERIPGSAFVVSRYDIKTIGISSWGFELGDICAQQRKHKLPDEDGNLPEHVTPANDPCTAVTPTGITHPPGPYMAFTLPVIDADGAIQILTPSSGGFINPIYVQNIPGRFAQPQSKLPKTRIHKLEDAQQLIELFSNPPTFTDGLEIGIKGLSQYRRETR